MMAQSGLGGTGSEKKGGGGGAEFSASANNNPSWSVLVLRNHGLCAHTGGSEERRSPACVPGREEQANTEGDLNPSSVAKTTRTLRNTFRWY